MCATLVRENQMTNDCGEVFARESAHLWPRELDAHTLGGFAEALGELVATDTAQVVTSTIEEEILDERTCVVAGRWIARSQSLVHLNERLAARCRAILLKRICKIWMLRIAGET